MNAFANRSLIGPIVLLALFGCGPSAEDVRIPVEGTVILGGKAVTHGAVILQPDAGKGNASRHEPRGAIGTDGKFRVQTGGQDGAPAGWYKVGVTVTEPVDPKNPYALVKSLIASKYNDPGTSGLAFEVVKTPSPGAYDIKLDSKAADAP